MEICDDGNFKYKYKVVNKQVNQKSNAISNEEQSLVLNAYGLVLCHSFLILLLKERIIRIFVKTDAFIQKGGQKKSYSPLI